MFLNKCDEIIAKKLQIDLAKKLQWIFFAVPQKKLRTQKMKIPCFFWQSAFFFKKNFFEMNKQKLKKKKNAKK